MSCAGGIFKKKGFTPLKRANYYHLICLPLRLLFAGLVYNFADNVYLKYTLIAVAIFAAIGNFQKLNECVWWSRKFHLFTSLLLLITTIMSLYNKKYNKLMAYILYADVILGFIYSLMVKPFK